jgi:Co/Zn/Cd efflux system component
MGGCSNDSCGDLTDTRYRRILWIILVLNAGMFFVEVFASFYSESVSLLADAGDFFADAANYGISLYVLNKALVMRARASLIKGATMALMGVFVIGNSIYHALTNAVPQAEIMGAVGALALIVNLGSAGLLYHYREGDSNRSSVWICSRNDAISNIMVILAAIGVTVTQSHWPDIVVASLIALLFLRSASNIIKIALSEIRESESGACSD